ncbi:hypothetical protein ACOSQ2_001961 [Xanthoceras sorbifolium]
MHTGIHAWPECAHTHRHRAACVLLLYLFVRFYIKLDELSAEITDLLVLLLKIVEVICTTSDISSNFKIIKQVDLGWVLLRGNKGSTGHLSLALGSCREIIVLLVPPIEAV